jgi:hypothetical protein
MRTFLSGICLLVTTIVFAQKECANSAYFDLQKSVDPAFATKINTIENFVRSQKVAARVSGQRAGSSEYYHNSCCGACAL